jgi:phosphoribosyl 1,2-cyclic phosphodiesterase
MLSVRFWGVRGSMPCPGPDTVLFGGNTACLEIRAEDRLIIIDSGTGIRPLGEKLLSGNYINGPVNADIFITHTHWDHIMGFPVFGPLFSPKSVLRIRGPVSSDEDTLESIIGTQLSYKFWPVRQNELAAKIEYGQLKETTIDLDGGVKVITKYLNHPILCLGYRFEYKGKVIVTLYDHEPYRNIFPVDPNDPGYDKDAALEGEAVAKEENEKIINFSKDADILIHDSQFTQTEYEKHMGWGHSSYDIAINTAIQAAAKKLIFYHHDPARTDWQLDNLEKNYQSLIADKGLEVFMAREGLTLNA